MNPLDQTLQNACPTIMVPKYEPLDPLSTPGHRYLAASDGLWVEIYRPWLHCIWPIARQTEMAMPYGELKKKVTLAFGSIPKELYNRFISDAVDAFPDEHAAWLVWNNLTKNLEYKPLKLLWVTSSKLKIIRPDLADHELLAVDLHSHGEHPASFSAVDDADDCDEVKLSYVVGDLHLDPHSEVCRLCIGGACIPINWSKLLCK